MEAFTITIEPTAVTENIILIILCLLSLFTAKNNIGILGLGKKEENVFKGQQGIMFVYLS